MPDLGWSQEEFNAINSAKVSDRIGQLPQKASQIDGHFSKESNSFLQPISILVLEENLGQKNSIKTFQMDKVYKGFVTLFDNQKSIMRSPTHTDYSQKPQDASTQLQFLRMPSSLGAFDKQTRKILQKCLINF